MKTLKLLGRSLFGTLVFLLILFISAGRIDYWQGWIYASVNIILVFINTLALTSKESLAEERSAIKEGAKSWDKRIVGLSAIVLIISYVVAGLDAGRYHLSPLFPIGVHAAGVLLLIAGEILFFSAQKQNKFFSSIVRIQTDRGHTVCDTGIYKAIRHPSYLGTILTALGIPLILGSLWCFIPAVLSIFLTVLRTSLEDITLLNELEGYREYTARTRYRLVPYIW